MTGDLFTSTVSQDLPWTLNMAAFINTSTRGWQFTSDEGHQSIFFLTVNPATFCFRAFAHYFCNLISRSFHFSFQYVTNTWLIGLSAWHSFPISTNPCHFYPFELTKKRSRRYPAKTITDVDYTDDIAILANTPNQAKTLLHSLERAATGIGIHVNAHKTEYICFNQAGDISTLDGTPLKLVPKFTYLGSSVSSTEKDIDTRLTKA